MAVRKARNKNQVSAPAHPSIKREGSGKQTEVIVIGDIYWDTVIVPLPPEHTDADPKRPENDNPYVRVDGEAGSWLLQRLIDQATEPLRGQVTVKGYVSKGYVSQHGELKTERTAQQGPDGSPYTLCGDRPPADPLNADEWGRALTVVKLFPKDADRRTKKQIYRISQCYSWLAPGCESNKRYPPASRPNSAIRSSISKPQQDDKTRAKEYGSENRGYQR
jgi:hypothetical protein